MKRLLLLAVTTLFLLPVACKKDDQTVNIPTATELLSKTWKMTALKATIAGETLNFMDSIATCITDNIYIFNKNGTYSSEEGTTKCSSDDPTVVESGTWQFASNETQLKLQVESWEFITGDNAWDILKLDATTLQLKYTLPADGEIPAITFEMTFTAL